jgi:hypothetical protein
VLAAIDEMDLSAFYAAFTQTALAAQRTIRR